MNLTKSKNIILNNVNLSFDSNLLVDVSCEFKAGKISCIVGESGSGKSSLLSLILGLLTPNSGEIFVSGLKLNQENIEKIREIIAWIPNSDIKFPEIEINKFIDNLKININIFNSNLAKFKLNNDILNKSFTQISSGEKQRLFLSIADYFSRDILIADEITSSLDKENKEIVLDYLKKSNKTIVVATHDKELLNIADEIFSIKDRRLTNGL